MRISIIIPALNEEKCLAKCLASVKNQDSSPEFWEVILVDNGSADRTLDIARNFGIRVYSLPQASISGLRNWGAMVAGGDILGFLDADMQVPGNWLRSIEFNIEERGLAVFGFTDIVPDDASRIGRIYNFAYRADKTRIREVDFLPARNLYLPKSIFWETGGFDPKLKTAEDKDFCFKLREKGYKIISVPGLDMVHLGYEKDFAEFLRKEYWRQGSLLALTRKWNYSLRTLRMPVICLQHLILLPVFGVSFWLALYHNHVSRPLVGLLFSWLMLPAVYISLLKTVSARNFKYFIWLVIIYFTRYFVGGISLLRQIKNES